MRLPDLYYTQTPLDGAPEPPGVAAPLQAFCGETLGFDQYLVYEGKPVSIEDFDLKAIVKTNSYARNKIWEGELNNGIYKKLPVGFYHVVIPAEVTGAWFPGTYWLELSIHEKAGVSNDVKDKVVFISRTPFCMDYSISSPSQDRLKDSVPEETQPAKVDPKQV